MFTKRIFLSFYDRHCRSNTLLHSLFFDGLASPTSFTASAFYPPAGPGPPSFRFSFLARCCSCSPAYSSSYKEWQIGSSPHSFPALTDAPFFGGGGSMAGTNAPQRNFFFYVLVFFLFG